MGHVNHRNPSSAGADEEPRLGFVQRETARRTFGAVLPLRHDSVRSDIDRYGDLLVLAVRIDPRPDRVHRKRLRPSPASHLHVGGVESRTLPPVENARISSWPFWGSSSVTHTSWAAGTYLTMSGSISRVAEATTLCSLGSITFTAEWVRSAANT